MKEMYDLIELFTVPTPPEDFAVYQVNTGNIYQQLSVKISLLYFF